MRQSQERKARRAESLRDSLRVQLGRAREGLLDARKGLERSRVALSMARAFAAAADEDFDPLQRSDLDDAIGKLDAFDAGALAELELGVGRLFEEVRA